MFIDFLTEDEQKVFLKLAVEIEKVAEDSSGEQQKRINHFISRVIGESGGNIKELEDTNLSLLERPLAKYAILIELISIGYASGEYCDNEKAYIKNLAKRIDVGSEKLSEIEEWVLGYVNQITAGVNLVNS